MERNVYHGWIIIEEPAPGMNPAVKAEWNEGGKRKQEQIGYGNSGCAQAMEWWDLRLGCTVLLEPTIKGCYRVYTKE